MRAYRRSTILRVFLIAVFFASAFGARPGQAAGPAEQMQTGGGSAPARPEGPRFGYNERTGKLNFVGGDAHAPLLGAPRGSLTAQALQYTGKSVIARYASDFGIQDPDKELRLADSRNGAGGSRLRYQQQYQGIPVMGGELLVNSDARGNVLSLNGDVSPDLALKTTAPAVTGEQAVQAALAGMKAWHGLEASSLSPGQPALWVYDERLLTGGEKPAVLVWRLEVQSKDGARPADELVLVDAASGQVALHFNQIDTAWGEGQGQEPVPTTAPLPEDTPVATETPTTEEPIQPEAVTPEDQPALTPVPVEAAAAGDEYYVSPSGDDAGNDCRAPSAPCKTVSNTVEKAAADGTVYMTTGTFGEKVWARKNINLSGGWNADFSAQIGLTTFDGTGISTPNDGIQTSYGAIKITNVLVKNFDTAISNDSTLDLSNCALIGNTRGFNNNAYATAVVTNCTVAQSAQHGITNGGNLTLRFSTLAENTPYGYDYKALYQYGYLNATTVLQGNIFTRNSKNCVVQAGSIVSQGYNLFDTNPGCVKLISSATYTSHLTDQTGVDPKLNPLIAGEHYPLDPASPAVDSIGAEVTCPATDQRGMPRPAGGACDAGSFEYGPAGPAASLSVVSGANQSVFPGQKFFYPLVVRVTDAYGSLIANAPVTFTAPESGASAIFDGTGRNSSTVQTGPDGVAVSPAFTANTVAGIYSVTASAGDNHSIDFALGNGDLAVYASPAGSDASNDCRVKTSPCKTMGQAEWKAAPGQLVMLAAGDYGPSSGSIDKSLTLSGGWDASYTVQGGRTRVWQADPNNSSTGLTVGDGVEVVAERIDFDQVYEGVLNYTGKLTLRDSAITRTQIGISNYGTLDLSNVTITQNIYNQQSGSEGWHPAALVNDGPQVDLNFVTIAQNGSYPFDASLHYGASAGGIRSFSGEVTLRNSIVAQNGSAFGFDCSGKITSLGHNLIGNSDGCEITAAAGDVIGSPEHPVMPRLGQPQDLDGSATVTVPLLAGSPAIDSADPASCLARDQSGAARPAGTGCDMGAYEGSIAGEPFPDVKTFTAGGETYWPGTLLCETPNENCTGGSDLDADYAHRLAIDVYHFYLDHFGRRSLNNNDMAILSTVHSGYAQNNAFWSGQQMVYGEGFSRADDVVAHELTHGVTRYESNLFYYWQSGAINESLSDLFGEYFDQTNGAGNDTPEAMWLLGEDLPGGAGRSMSNPPAYDQPDRMKSTLYYIGGGDNAGVHVNSGVNNKAAYLMVAGGDFNGKSVAPLGWEKTAALYDYAQRNLLTSVSDYGDLYNALNQACAVLTGGAEGITGADCQQVVNALDAVQMNLPPGAADRPQADACPAGTYRGPVNLFADDFENGSTRWAFSAASRETRWRIVPNALDAITNATSGTRALFASDYDGRYGAEDQQSNTWAAIKTGIKVPAGVSTFLRFNHAFSYEYGLYQGALVYVDGGVVEYSIDNGRTWLDAKALFSAGQNYKGKLWDLAYPGRNPLHGRSAFLADSGGYVSTRYNLSSLAGKTVLLRFRSGTDYTGSLLGWIIDDVTVYTCLPAPSAPALVSPAAAGLVTVYRPKLDWKNVLSADHYQLQVARDAQFTQMVLDAANLAVSEFTFSEDLAANTSFSWRARAINAVNVTGAWSKTWTFRTRMVAPVPAPFTDTPVTELRPPFSWSASPGATSYTLVVSTYANLSYPKLNVTVKGTSYQPTANLPAGKLLYWRVRANGANPSAWSPTLKLTTPRPPSTPVLSSPAANALLTNLTPKLSWKPSTVPLNATPLGYYYLEVDDSVDFSSPVFSQYDLTTTAVTLPELASNQKYYWRVRACNQAVKPECSAWAKSYFREAMLPTALLSPLGGTPLADTTPDFDWEDRAGAASYTIVISTSSTFATPLVSVTVTGSQYASTKVLPRGKPIYWRVRANGANGPSVWSNGSFVIQ